MIIDDKECLLLIGKGLDYLGHLYDFLLRGVFHAELNPAAAPFKDSFHLIGNRMATGRICNVLQHIFVVL